MRSHGAPAASPSTSASSTSPACEPQISLKFKKMDGEQSRRIQCLYPQLLGAIIYLNPPRSVAFLYNRVIRPLLPRKVTEKSFALSPAVGGRRATLGAIIRPRVCTGASAAPRTPTSSRPSEADAAVARCIAHVMSASWAAGFSRCDINTLLIDRAAEEVEAAVRRGEDPEGAFLSTLWPRLEREMRAAGARASHERGAPGP